MYRVLTSSNRAVAQRVVRSTLAFTRASSTDPEAGSVSSGQGAFGKKEKAEETRWARRHEAEQAEKYRTAEKSKAAQGGGQQGKAPQANSQQQSGRQDSTGSSQQRLTDLQAEKRRIEQEIDQLKRQQS